MQYFIWFYSMRRYDGGVHQDYIISVRVRVRVRGLASSHFRRDRHDDAPDGLGLSSAGEGQV